MHPIPGGANAKPFVTHHNALEQEMYLRIAPELYLKRLVVGGFERVFEINRNFRNEGISVRHNPEFTMMEFYAAYWNYQDLMGFTEQLVRDAALKATGTLQLSYQGREVDLAQPFARLTIREAIFQYTEAGAHVDDAAWLISALKKLGMNEEEQALCPQPGQPAGAVLRGNGGRQALAAHLHHGAPDRDIAPGPCQRHAPRGDRAL
jgi:lysyl-tRNA synthetase class 2